VLATSGDAAALDSYYRAIAPFYLPESRTRGDVSEWRTLARRVGARRILDLGCGGGRIALALKEDDPRREVVGVDISTALQGGPDPGFTFVKADMRELPLDEEFDLIVAANDPFSHLLEDADRARAIAEARRLLAHDGLLVIDGLYVPPQDDAVASLPDGLIRERRLGDGTRLREIWHAVGEHRYVTRHLYERDGSTPVDASTILRAWYCGELALRESAARVAGALDERDFDPWGDRLVAVIPGWSSLTP
jgi:SAM-dependent methyltransferase